MNWIEGFVHLYHVWGIWGAVTALIYGPSAWRSWRENGGTFSSLASEYAGAVAYQSRELVFDVVRVTVGIMRGLFGVGPVIGTHKTGWHYPREHMLLIGITLGGFSRFLTAIYWSEKNRAWMHADNMLVMAAVPVIIAVVADAHHQIIAWPKRPWLARWLAFAGLAWIALGLAGIL